MTGSDAAAAQSAEDLPKLEGMALVIAVVVLASATFMSFLDASIAMVALPHIAGTFGVTPHEGVWAMTSYAVAEAVTVPLTGWVGARFGNVRVFIAASLAFGLFSFMCGLAPSIGALVGARILQGLAGGFLIPMSQILIQQIMPPKHAHLGIAAWGATALSAPIFGPVIGGFLCDGAGWAWCFFVNVPVAALCVAVPWFLLGAPKPKRVHQRIDIVGLALLVLWVTAFQIMLDNGEQKDWFGSGEILGLACIALLGMAAFVIWELTDHAPIVDLRVFRHRAFSISMLVMFAGFGGVATFNVVFVLWLQSVMGYTATWAGYVIVFLALLAAAISPVIGIFMGRYDSRIIVSAGLALTSVSLLIRVTNASNMAFEDFILAQLMTGIGITCFLLPINGVGMGAVEPDEMASAAGLLSFARALAIGVGAAAGVGYWTRLAAHSHAELAGLVRPVDLSAAGLQQMPPSSMRAMTEALVQAESLTLASNQTFFILGLIFAAAALLIWLAPRQAARAGGAMTPH